VDANALLASLFVSSIGLVTFLYGKKQGRLPQLVIGFVLIVYSYFLSSVAWMLAIAAALLGLLWLVVRLGW
jgi:predicted phage tail protein